jgi:hypothetical protein
MSFTSLEDARAMYPELALRESRDRDQVALIQVMDCTFRLFEETCRLESFFL